jgi:hypothetical protein
LIGVAQPIRRQQYGAVGLEIAARCRDWLYQPVRQIELVVFNCAWQHYRQRQD